MSCLSHVSSYSAAILRRTRTLIARSSLHPSYSPLSWKAPVEIPAIKTSDLGFLLTRFRVQCYSSKRSSSKKTSLSRKLETESVMEQENDEFFVVRKGDVVGVYKSLADCQAQVGASICNPPVSVYKGYSLPKDTEEYLVSHGLKNALYTIRAADLKDDLFGSLVPCPFQEPSSKKRSRDTVGTEVEDGLGTTSISTNPLTKHVKLDTNAKPLAASSDSHSCVMEFDGASKGNPGPAGAAAVLRNEDGSLICKLREGLGIATNNVAEYRALLLGLRYALNKGYKNIRIKGDSKLVCMQVFGSWKAKHENISGLCAEAKMLRKAFSSFHLTHVLRNLNTEADAQANLAVNLAAGEIAVEFED